MRNSPMIILDSVPTGVIWMTSPGRASLSKDGSATPGMAPTLMGPLEK